MNIPITLSLRESERLRNSEAEARNLLSTEREGYKQLQAENAKLQATIDHLHAETARLTRLISCLSER